MSFCVLVVDDSALMRKIIIKTLIMAGVSADPVFEASNGSEALTLLEKNWIDIVFADINMPEMNGIELLEDMAERGLLNLTPVVIISTDRSEIRHEEARLKGAYAYLHKPFTPEDLRDVVNGLMVSGRLGQKPVN